jgi:peroxin-11B
MPLPVSPVSSRMIPRTQAHTAKVRPFSPPTIQAINQRAAKLWFTGIAFSIASSLYRLVDLNKREQQARRVRSSEKEAERKAELKALLACVFSLILRGW